MHRTGRMVPARAACRRFAALLFPARRVAVRGGGRLWCRLAPWRARRRPV